MNHRIQSGRPWPLGAHWDGTGVNFALFSAHAERVELCLFDPRGRHEVARLTLPENSGHIWHGYLPELRPGQLYGYRVHGPYEPELGHRFNPNKLLIDPYARALSGALKWSNSQLGYRANSSQADLSFDRQDSQRGVPKCVVVDPSYQWGQHRRPDTPWSQSCIYEMHLRGFTMQHPAIGEAERGTFTGLADHQVIAYLKALGITAVELLPVHAFVDDRFLCNKGLVNYWGYSTLNFFAPEQRYLGPSGINDVKRAVAKLHDAGIEVILDVVYNHTCEGSELGPTLSFRGIDNASYYRLMPDNPRHYINDTGCGNTLNTANPHVMRMVLDSLRYWAEDMQIDGFRFDLASVLGREQAGFDPNGGFFDAIRQDPVLATRKLIAEPWDIGPGGYQLGNYPTPFGEWNDRFRDCARRYWRGEHGVMRELADKLLGSASHFDHSRRAPSASVNFITAHDGFTLADLVSYEHKHNDTNGEDNRDGHDGNHSCNHGVEGPTDDPTILARRAQHRRNLIATLFVAQGTPMLLAGDEMGHSQGGNNNAYCQDNATTWIDWEAIDDELLLFSQRLIALRRDHIALRQPRFLHGTVREGDDLPDVSWVAPDGEHMDEDAWHGGQTIGMLLAGQSNGSNGRDDPFSGYPLLVMINGADEAVLWQLPPQNGRWLCVMHTDAQHWREPASAAVVDGSTRLPARSTAVYRLHNGLNR